MRKLGNDIDMFVAELSGNDEQARINLRARQVRDRYKQALETVYRDQAALFLAHTNNVYIMSKGGVRTLIVYVDESIFAAELNAQRELIKLKLLELFGEELEEFEIHVSRGSYKNNHPYVIDEADSTNDAIQDVPLDDEEMKRVLKTVSGIENEKVRKALESAMEANIKSQKFERDHTHDK